MKRQHSKSRRLTTAIMFGVIVLIFTIISIFSIINKDNIETIIFNVSTALICLIINIILLTNKDVKEKEKKQEERDKNFK